MNGSPLMLMNVRALALLTCNNVLCLPSAQRLQLPDKTFHKLYWKITQLYLHFMTLLCHVLGKTINNAGMNCTLVSHDIHNATAMNILRDKREKTVQRTNTIKHAVTAQSPG